VNWYELGNTGVAHVFRLDVALRRRTFDQSVCAVPVRAADIYRVKAGDPVLSYCEYCRKLKILADQAELPGQIPGY